MNNFSIGLTYTVWVDVQAKDQDDAIDLACNSNYDLNLKVGKNKTNVTPCLVELQEYADPIVQMEEH